MKNEAATPKGDNIRVDAENCTPTEPPKKIELNVFSLLHQGPKGLNQPEAHSLYRESCLNTSICSLKKKGISIISLPDLDSVRYFNQKPFHRYWLATDIDRQRAVNLLNHYRQKRGLGKIDFAPWHDTDKKSA